VTFERIDFTRIKTNIFWIFIKWVFVK
jgi:hypothetical protein